MRNMRVFLAIFIATSLLFSWLGCKKSVPEVETKNDLDAGKDDGKDTAGASKSTEVVRKITDEQFQEAEELVLRAKEAMADVYDNDNYQGSIDALKQARDSNESDPKAAFSYLDTARKKAQDAYYNAYKQRAIEKKEEADRLMADLAAIGVTADNSDAFKEASGRYDNGSKAFDEPNYKYAYTEFAAAVDLLNNLKNGQDRVRQEFESKIGYVESLIKKAEAFGAATYAPDELASAKDHLQKGRSLYAGFDMEGSKGELDGAEQDALSAIKKTEAALLEKKRLEAIKAIKDAGRSLENAANKPVVDDKGNVGKGLDYQFEFDEKGKGTTGEAPDTSASYKDILMKSAEYIEKAKDAFYREDYEMAVKYAAIAKKIADSYNGGGIKTVYTVRLIPEKRDCLWRIAEYDFIYGNPFYWPMIWKANKEKILNPDLIYPGQQLAVPELD